MKINNWTKCIQDLVEWKEEAEKAKPSNNETVALKSRRS